MIIKSISGYKLGQTSYLLIKDEEAILIDCGFEMSVLDDYLRDNRIKILGVFLTHGHADHSMSATEFINRGIPVYASEFSEDITRSGYDLGRFIGIKFNRFSPTVKLSDGAIVRLGNFEINSFSTPGHTRDGVCYLIDGVLFSGDTLLSGSYGRIDLPTADKDQMISSLKRLFRLDFKIPVCSGHERVSKGVQPFFPSRTIGDYRCSQDIAYLLYS